MGCFCKSLAPWVQDLSSSSTVADFYLYFGGSTHTLWGSRADLLFFPALHSGIIVLWLSWVRVGACGMPGIELTVGHALGK